MYKPGAMPNAALDRMYSSTTSPVPLRHGDTATL